MQERVEKWPTETPLHRNLFGDIDDLKKFIYDSAMCKGGNSLSYKLINYEIIKSLVTNFNGNIHEI